MASARRLGIPARLGFAELPRPDPDRPGDRRWFKLSTACNIELCERFGVRALEFDGTTDAVMHPYDVNGNRPHGVRA